VFKPLLKSRVRPHASASRQVSTAPVEHFDLEDMSIVNPVDATPDPTVVTAPQNPQPSQPLPPPLGAEPSEKKSQRKSSSGESRKGQKRRAPSLPPFDPTADPGEDLDETAVLMGDLCNDTGHGRVSSKAAQIRSNHAAWKVSNRDKRARMKGIMELRKYGKQDDESVSVPAGALSASAQQATNEAGPSSGVRATGGADSVAPQQSDHGFDYSQTMSTSRYNVQVRTGPNGEIMVDEDSLYVNRHQEAATEGYTHVEESDTTKFINSATYGKKYRGSRWSVEETELFYDVSRLSSITPVMGQRKPGLVSIWGEL
jgi:transcription factor TFIIIB component B''